MGQFITIPWFGVDTPSAADCIAYGVPSTNDNGVLSYGTNSAVQTPVIVIGKITNTAYGIAVNSGFGIATSANLNPRRTYMNTQYGVSGVYYAILNNSAYMPTELTESFSSLNEMMEAFIDSISPAGYRNIKYSFASGRIIGPDFVPIGSNVTVYVTANPGATVTSENISIMRGGSPIEFNYSGGVLTFTAS